MAEQIHLRTCPLCEAMCGLEISVEDERAGMLDSLVCRCEVLRRTRRQPRSEVSMPKRNTTHAAVLMLGLALLMIPACAAAQNQRTEQIEIQLSNAGFEARSADDPQAGAWLNTLTPRQLGPVKTADGTTRYVYADPEGCHCVYVGDKAAYQIYQARDQTRRQSQDAEAEEYAEEGLVADEIYDYAGEEGLR